MFKYFGSVFSIFLLCSLQISAQAPLETVVIDRSPSAFESREAFFAYIEGRIQQAAVDNPGKSFCIDYNTLLVRLFGRLESNPAEKELWLAALRSHSEQMNRRRVRGLKIVQRALDDLPFVSALVEPYVDNGTLQTLDFSSVFRPNTCTEEKPKKQPNISEPLC
jgi:hypothetical protein